MGRSSCRQWELEVDVAHATQAASVAVDAYVAKSKQELNAAISEGVRIASSTAVALQRRLMLQGAAGVLIALAVLGGIAWFVGKDAGRAEALGEAHAAAVWAETPEGKAAKALSDAGELGALLRCDRPGWRVDKLSKAGRVNGLTRLCTPHAEKGSVYGWRLFDE